MSVIGFAPRTDHGPDPELGFIITAGARQSWLPASAVGSVGIAGPATPVPFAPAAYEGLVDADGIASAQLDLGSALGGPPRTGRFAMRIESERGLVLVRVDAVEPAHRPPDPGVNLLEPILQRLLAPLAPGPSLNPACADPLAATDAPEVPLLVVTRAGRRRALPAEAVLKVGRAVRMKTLGAEFGSDACLVLVDGDWLRGFIAPGQESVAHPWAVVVACGAEQFALLVEDVVGLIGVPAAEVRSVRMGQHQGPWWLPRDTEPLEILQPDRLVTSSLAPAAPGPEAAGPPLRLTGAAETDEPMPALDLGVRLGTVLFVVPQNAILSVVRRESTLKLLRRGRGALPVLDLARLWPSASDASDRLVLVERPGRRPFALGGGPVHPVPAAGPWQALPPVPPELAVLADGVRRDPGGGWQLRCNLSAGATRPAPALRARLRTAGAGWLAPVPA